MRLALGLTGGIGSGKSSVARALQQRGATLLDADAISRELTGPGGAAMPALVERFGHAAARADGALDRDAMRERAFHDPGVRHALEAVLHPLIASETLARANATSSDVVVFDIPLLAESGHWRARLQRILVVDCRESTQIERVMRRSGWTRAMVERVIAQQASRTARRALADAVIHNDDGMTLDGLARAAVHVLARWCPQRMEQ